MWQLVVSVRAEGPLRPAVGRYLLQRRNLTLRGQDASRAAENGVGVLADAWPDTRLLFKASLFVWVGVPQKPRFSAHAHAYAMRAARLRSHS